MALDNAARADAIRRRGMPEQAAPAMDLSQIDPNDVLSAVVEVLRVLTNRQDVDASLKKKLFKVLEILGEGSPVENTAQSENSAGEVA